MTEQRVHFRDFSRAKKVVHFDIDDVTYQCVNGLSVKKLQQLLDVARTRTGDEDADATVSASSALDRATVIMKLLLKKESFADFERKINDEDDPIELDVLGELVQWLVEVYTARPTEPSSSSSGGSPSDDGGTSLTAGVQPAELTQRSSRSLDSSTSSTTGSPSSTSYHHPAAISIEMSEIESTPSSSAT